ncbi:4625_t:CDS:1, partial [Funneliformis mosseae]
RECLMSEKLNSKAIFVTSSRPVNMSGKNNGTYGKSDFVSS